MLAAASTSGPPTVSPAQLAIASGATTPITSATRAGSSPARSSCWWPGEPGRPVRLAVTTSTPAAADSRRTWPPRNPLAPRISSRMAWLLRSKSLVILTCLEPGQVCRVTEPFDGLGQALVPGVLRPPPSALAELRRVTHQPHHFRVLGTQPLRVLHNIGLDTHKSGDILRELADRDVVAGAAVEQLADHRRRRRLAECHERRGGVQDVGEVACRVERAQHQLLGTARELGNDLRDDRAGGLARAEGVERPQRHHGQPEAEVVRLGEFV